MGSWYNTTGRINPCTPVCGSNPQVPSSQAEMQNYIVAKTKYDSCMKGCQGSMGQNLDATPASITSIAPTRTDSVSSHDTAELVPLGVGKSDTSTGMSIGSKIGIGVGIVALASVLYFMRRGKN